MDFKIIRGKKLYFKRIGKGFPVLLGHSYFFDHTMWQAQIDVLSKKYCVIATDLWGHGQSDDLPSNTTFLRDIAKDHLALMDSLKIKEFAVIGLSVGGMWGAELAALAPHRVKSLVLMDSYIGSETAEVKQQYKQMLDAAESLGTIQPPLSTHVASQFYSDEIDPSVLKNLENKIQGLTEKQVRTNIVPIGRLIFMRPDRREILKQITMPALVATGEKDKPRPPSEGEEMASIIGCKHVIIPKAGHISCEENPKAVTKMLTNFLQKTISESAHCHCCCHKH